MAATQNPTISAIFYVTDRFSQKNWYALIYFKLVFFDLFVREDVISYLIGIVLRLFEATGRVKVKLARKWGFTKTNIHLVQY